MTGEARMDRDPEFQEILSLLPGTVLGRGMEQFTKSGYRPSLAAYTDENRRIFERMQRFCARYPERTDEALRLACRTLLDAVAAYLAAPRKKQGLNERALRLDTCKMFWKWGWRSESRLSAFSGRNGCRAAHVSHTSWSPVR